MQPFLESVMVNTKSEGGVIAIVAIFIVGGKRDLRCNVITKMKHAQG